MKAKCTKTIAYENGTMFTIGKEYDINLIEGICSECEGCDDEEIPADYKTIDDDNAEHCLTEDWFQEHFIWLGKE